MLVENSSPIGKTGANFVSEFIGTFFLVLTVGLNVIGGSAAPALSIGASLMFPPRGVSCGLLLFQTGDD